MKTPEEILESRGYAMADAPSPAGIYTPVVVHNRVAYLSGSVPATPEGLAFVGSVPSEVTIDQATAAAEICAANLLRVLAPDVGPLSTIERVLKLTGSVNSDPRFTDPHLVVNGASHLLIDVLGEAGRHARSAVGMATLPLGVPVEVEMIVALH